MNQSRIAEIVNKLTDMLADTGIDSYEIYEALGLTYYEAAYVGLDWLVDMYEKNDYDKE